MMELFNTYVRSSLEYASQVWNPCQIGEIDLVESVQRRFTKRLPGLKHLSYPDRLKQLGLKSLELRRLHQDMILTYKIMHGLVRVNRQHFFDLKSDRTRNNGLSIYKRKFRLNSTKNFFTNRVVNIWNSLPSKTVLAPNQKLFRKYLSTIDLSSFFKGRGLDV